MVQRIALLVGGLGAIGVLAVALGFGGLGGFASADPANDLNANLTADTSAVSDPAPAAETPATARQPEVVTKTVKDKVYVLPTQKPKVVRIDNGPASQPAANNTAKTNTASAPTRSSNAEPRDDGGHESADRERGDRGERGGGERGDD